MGLEVSAWHSFEACEEQVKGRKKLFLSLYFDDGSSAGQRRAAGTDDLGIFLNHLIKLGNAYSAVDNFLDWSSQCPPLMFKPLVKIHKYWTG